MDVAATRSFGQNRPGGIAGNNESRVADAEITLLGKDVTAIGSRQRTVKAEIQIARGCSPGAVTVRAV